MKTMTDVLNENNQDFLDDLLKEKERQPIVNDLYKELYPGCVIETINYEESDRNKKLQKRDIDRIIHHNGKEIFISEKFRDNDGWGLSDIVVEIYSNVKTREPGWAIESDAQYLFYYKDNKVCIIDAQGLKKIALSIMEQLKGKTRDDIPGFRKGKVISYPMTIDGKLVNGKLMMPKTKYQSWDTLTYIISIKDLKSNKNTNDLKVLNYATNW